MANDKKSTAEKKTLRKKDLASLLSKKFADNGVSMSVRNSAQFIDYLREIMMDTLVSGSSLMLQGFLKAESKEQKEKRIFDPQLKTFRYQEASQVVRLSISAVFKEKFKNSLKGK